MAARSASSAVTESRTSPTRITSGSCRSSARSPRAKVMPVFSSTGTWVMPVISISIGSSSVTTLRSVVIVSWIAA